ncbi:MAG: DUF805 domain-containing protein [Roseinatronobacter sp.]
MTFVDAVKSGFQNALKFSGRSRRPDYWWFFLFAFAGAFVLSLVDALIFGEGRTVLARVFQIVVFVPFLAVAWRRLQDTGKPGWWVLIPSTIVTVSAIVAGSVGRQLLGQLADGSAAPMMTGSQAGFLLVLSLAQIVAGLLIIWWMTRPSQKGPNAYGPEPRVRGK